MKLKTWLSSILLFVFCVCVFAVYDYMQFMSRPFNIATGEKVRLDVTSGRSLKSISRELNNKNIIDQKYYLALAARINNQSRYIQAGEYDLDNTLTPRKFLDILVAGKVVQYSFTIIEGWNVKQVLQALKNNANIDHTLKNVTASKLMKELKLPADLHAEGWFFPDTYNFSRGETDTKVLMRAHKAMQRNLNSEWEKRDKGLPYDTPYDALIMASIIEKETGKGSERTQISGVFVRRLRKNMKLQTDPTVIYGIGEKYDGNIRRRDLRKDTPYNTYTRKGMPPTPIAMPGLAAIRAALHPESGTALYFVAKGDGSHVFSTNLKQHNEAVIKYQLKGRPKDFSSFTSSGKK